MTKKMARRIIELLYHHAWGKEGNADLRDEFHAIYKEFQSQYKDGKFLYHGAGVIKWQRSSG